MDLAFTSEERQFADEVRAFVKANLPADIRDKVKNGKHLGRDDYMRWQQALGAQGWLVYTWPKKHGGPGFTPAQRYIFENICAEENAPGIIPFGTKMVGPVIYTFGNEAQKAKFLEPIRRSTVWWCQGYSEPGSGSDLASLRTKAEKQGDHYIVNGSKTWNTMGHWADWIFCLVRTDPKAKPQEGISFLLIDMKTPGITVKPIIMADGGHEVNEVFFDNVKVPVENLIGKEGEGWTYAKFLLANERLGIAAVPQSKRGVEALKDIARAELEDGKPLIKNQTFAEKIADLEIQVTALEYTELRVLSSMAHGGQPGPEVSGLKIRGSEIQQRIAELAMEAVGEYAAPYLPGLLWQGSNEEPVGPSHAHIAAPRYFNTRKTTIYGGSNEIQKGIISKMVLGL
jgi:alkylation response protein AidB-like acyl-CoA dehydrogenase